MSVSSDVLDLHCELILDQYDERAAVYARLREVVDEKIKGFLSTTHIEVFSAQSRVKKRESLAGKLALKGERYRSIDDITDILGERIVTYYADDVDLVAAFIERTFVMDWDNSVDKRAILEPSQFGYLSLHYICSVPRSLYYDPAMPELNDVRFEVQMRSALQHVWAQITHDTGYKADFEVPARFIRSYSKMASLIELADEEFVRIRDGLDDYRSSVVSLIREGRYDDLELDGETLTRYLEDDPFGPLSQRIAAINGAEVRKASYHPYLRVFKLLGFECIGDIDRMLTERAEDAYNLARVQLRGTDLDIISSTLALQNLCIAQIIRNGGGERHIRGFLTLTMGERANSDAFVQRIMHRAAEAGVTGIHDEPNGS